MGFTDQCFLSHLSTRGKDTFADTPYKTPEEFKENGIKTYKKNLQLYFNNTEQITLGKGVVKLGHETKVVFEVLDIPANIESVVVKNTTFKDVGRNKTTLLLFKNGFVKNNFTLSKDNDHIILKSALGACHGVCHYNYIICNTCSILNRKFFPFGL